MENKYLEKNNQRCTFINSSRNYKFSKRNEKRYGIERIPVDAIERMKNSMDIPSNEEKDARLKSYWEIDGDGWITEHTL